MTEILTKHRREKNGATFTLGFAVVEYADLDWETARCTAEFYSSTERGYWNSKTKEFSAEAKPIEMRKETRPCFSLEFPSNPFPVGLYWVEFNVRDDKGFHLKDFADFRVVQK